MRPIINNQSDYRNNMPAAAAANFNAKSDFSLSVSRALRNISSFSPNHPERGSSELTRLTESSKASVLRFLEALETHGYVDRHAQTRLYPPGPETARVDSLYRSPERLCQFAMPAMHELVQCGLSGSVASSSSRRRSPSKSLAEKGIICVE